MIKTRFAPSPTGYLHIGGLRTALYNFLIAKQNKGEFILRIEDTDRERLIKGADKNLIKILLDMGLKFDNEPVYQSEKKEAGVYQKYIDKLLAEGKAYKCFCTPEELTAIREDQKNFKKVPGYYGSYRKCNNLTPDEIKQKEEQGLKAVIRFRIPDLGLEEIIWKDQVYGEIKVPLKDIEDFVILKSDGYPTYNFANVIDDNEMGVTHVVRGEEFVSSTIKHLFLYHALGWAEIDKNGLITAKSNGQDLKFIHLPLILGKDKKKLSKRQDDVSLESYLQKGFLPEAILNYVALLGWNPGKGSEREIFSLQDLLKEFNFKNINKSGAVFDLEKLEWINGEYIKSKEPKDLINLVLPFLKETPYSAEDEYLEKIIAVEQPRLKTLADIKNNIAFYFDEPKYEKDLLIWKKLSLKDIKQNLENILNLYTELDSESFTQEKLEQITIEWLKNNNYGTGDYLWPMRVALTGLKNSPGPFEIASVIGKTDTVKRIKNAIDKI